MKDAARTVFGKGMLGGLSVTIRRFARTFGVDAAAGRATRRRGGGPQWLDFWRTPEKGHEPVVSQDETTEGLWTVEYPDERLPVRERFRVLPVLIYDEDDGHVRCTCCNICAKVCPPQCIWMTQAESPKGVVPLPEEFVIDMDVCMNCGLCAEYCPFDAIKMDQNFEVANYERHQSHVYTMQDLLVSSEYYARGHPESWSSPAEQGQRAKVAKQKAQREARVRPAPKPGETPPTGTAPAAT